MTFRHHFKERAASTVEFNIEEYGTFFADHNDDENPVSLSY
jgi:hypothetical protein